MLSINTLKRSKNSYKSRFYTFELFLDLVPHLKLNSLFELNDKPKK